MLLRQKVQVDTFMKILISTIAVIVIVYLPDYDNLIYQSMKMITSEILSEDDNYYKGYLAGEGIISINSVEDIDANTYFTIEVSKKNIVLTDYYKKYVYYSDEIYQIKGISKYINRIFRNIKNEKIAQFCVVTLQSGEKCFVLIDTDLINVNTSKTIKLPIGEKDTSTYQIFNEIASREGVSSEECKYFIDTTYDSYSVETKLEQIAEMKGWAALFIFIVTYVIFTKVFKKFDYKTEVEMIRDFWKQIKE